MGRSGSVERARDGEEREGGGGGGGGGAGGERGVGGRGMGRQGRPWVEADGAGWKRKARGGPRAGGDTVLGACWFQGCWGLRLRAGLATRDGPAASIHPLCVVQLAARACKHTPRFDAGRGRPYLPVRVMLWCVVSAPLTALLRLVASTPPLQVEVVTDGGEEEIELDDSPGAAWRLDVGPVPLVLSVSQVGGCA